VAIALVQTVRATGTNATSTVSKSVTVTAGNTLLVFVQGGSGQTVTGVSGGGNTYNSQTSVTHTAYAMKVTSFVASNIAGGTYTVQATFNANTDYPWIMVVEFSTAADADGSGAAYYGSPSSTSTDALATSAATNSVQPAMMFGLIFGAGSSSPGTGFSFDTFGSDMGIAGVGYSANWATQYKTLTTTTSVTAFWSNGNSGDSIGVIMQIIDQYVPPSGGAVAWILA